MNDFGHMKANSKDRNAEKLIKQDFRVGRGLVFAPTIRCAQEKLQKLRELYDLSEAEIEGVIG